MNEYYDVVIVGAGIHGAGVAQAAAASGYSVLVLEQTDVAAWTSSRSSKLIHGGLRYLESGRLSLVRESLRERGLLLRLAPSLVRLQRFHIPIYSDTRRRPWRIRLGLAIYAALAGGGDASRFGSLPRSQWSALDGLTTKGLQAVFEYRDAQTDDRALTRAVMRSASEFGAELRAPARFVDARLDETGCIVDYIHAESQKTCRARVVINAAGAWANTVLSKIRPAIEPLTVELVQGTHLVLEGRLERGVYYLEAPSDGRAVFAMPWQDHILLGTTETSFKGDPSTVEPLEQERRYLLQTLARYFPDYAGGRAHVIDEFAGLRVLPATDQIAFKRSRETVLHVDRVERPRVLTIYGGKLTVYRATAEKVMARISASLPQRTPFASTRDLPLVTESG
jgi:glycerol-3-phosphate dehydrogenase